MGLRNHWTDDAACRGLPLEWFFPPKSQGDATYQEGKAVCAGCTVTAECLALTDDFIATGDRYGLFGGMTPSERKKERWKQLGTRLWPL